MVDVCRTGDAVFHFVCSLCLLSVMMIYILLKICNVQPTGRTVVFVAVN